MRISYTLLLYFVFALFQSARAITPSEKPSPKKETQNVQTISTVKPFQKKLFTAECVHHLGVTAIYFTLLCIIISVQLKGHPKLVANFYKNFFLEKRILCNLLGLTSLMLPSLLRFVSFWAYKMPPSMKGKEKNALLKKNGLIDLGIGMVSMLLGYGLEVLFLKTINWSYYVKIINYGDNSPKMSQGIFGAALSTVLVFSAPLLYPIFSVLVKSILYKKNLQNLPMSPLPKEKKAKTSKE